MLLLTEGQMSDHAGARLMYDALRAARVLIGDKGYDSDYDSDAWREALAAKGVAACIPPKKNRKIQHFHCATLYKQRHKIENMFGRRDCW